MSIFTSKLCETCNIADICWCRTESQTAVNNCGMDKVIANNKKLRTRSQTYDNPDYVDFMNEQFN